MLLWWDALTMIEKRVPVNKDMLVRTTESSILAQATTFGNVGGNTSQDSSNSNGNGGSGNNEEKGDDK